MQDQSGKPYDATFFDYTDEMALASARRVLPLCQEMFRPASVADFGCGRGGWLSIWRSLGVEQVVGIDGDYVRRDRLLIESREFIAHDLTKPIDLGRQFDLVQSLEVAEHLPASVAQQFVQTLVRHGQTILFSAATPGQGGYRHVNERPYAYWRALFDKHQYVMLDPLRHALQQEPDVQPWYRYNSFVFVSAARFEQLSPALRATRLSMDQPIPDLRSLPGKLRCLLIRPLPTTVVNWLSQLSMSLNTLRAPSRR